MKIVKLETFTNEFVGFVRATSETGAQGWGQVSTYNADLTCEIFHRQVARHALGTGIVGGMILATYVAILFIPMFFELSQTLSEKFSRKKSPPH